MWDTEIKLLNPGHVAPVPEPSLAVILVLRTARPSGRKSISSGEREERLQPWLQQWSERCGRLRTHPLYESPGAALTDRDRTADTYTITPSGVYQSKVKVSWPCSSEGSLKKILSCLPLPLGVL